MKKKLYGMLLCVVSLLAVLAVVMIMEKGVDSLSEKNDTISEASLNSETESLTESVTEEDSEAVSEVGTEALTEAETETETANLGYALNNPQIDLSGLDTTVLDWGVGANFDEQNVPAGPKMYNEKYGQYGGVFWKDTNGEKIIYLTFDEGYEYGFTPTILDTLKEKDVHAVFFLTAPFIEEHPDYVQRMIDEGHELGNHSVNHPSDGVASKSIEEQTNEVMGVHNMIEEQFGYTMHLFRYPAGKFSEQSLALLNNLGYQSIFWSFAHYDYNTSDQPDQTESLQKMVDRLHPGAIYLLHAVSETNTAVLGDFIDQAQALGYRFELIP